MEYYSKQMNKILMHATTWVNLENIMLSEGSQIQKITCCKIIGNNQNRQFYIDKK
jgi:hypothetical protein